MVEDFISYNDVSQQSTGIKNFSMMFRAHCLKSVQIRSYFWSVFSCIRTEYGDLRSRYGPEITLYLDTFHAVAIHLKIDHLSRFLALLARVTRYALR